MASRVVSWPPLGQITVVSHKTIDFAVAIEPFHLANDLSWEVVIWHNGYIPQEWKALNLHEVEYSFTDACFEITTLGNPKKFFRGSLPKRSTSPTRFNFTLKFRAGDGKWTWVKDRFSVEDGEVLFQTEDPFSSDLSTYVHDLSSELSVTFQRNGPSDTNIWELSLAVLGADGDTSRFHDVMLGLPRDFSQWFALVRCPIPWLAPRHGKGRFSPTEDVILCSFLRRDGIHMLLLSVTVGNVLTCIKSAEGGGVIISSRNDSPDTSRSYVIAAAGRTFEAANSVAMKYASEILQKNTDTITVEDLTRNDAVALQELKHGVEEMCNGLTYCTWNSLGQELDEGMVSDAVRELSENGIQVANLIIDDNWQSLDKPGQNQFERGWTDFEANANSFPNKLKGLTTRLRDEHKNLRHIGIWHGIFGYWGGVSPGGDLAKRYKTRQIKKDRDFYHKNILTVFDAQDVHQVYDNFYKFLKQSGVTTAKADTRYLLDCLTSAKDRAALIPLYKDAWLSASHAHLSMLVISCMALIPQLIFSSDLLPREPQRSPRIILRNSDDFFPDEPSSHGWHIFCNAHVSLLTQHLNAIPDWDMFQTSHEYAEFHAAARCVSGGPVSITDKPRRHSLDLIRQMTARPLTQKADLVLRPSAIGRSVQVYGSHDESQFCKVGSYHEVSIDSTEDRHPSNHDSAQIRTSILGVFNMASETCIEFISLSDLLDHLPSPLPTQQTQMGEKDQDLVLRTHRTARILGPIKVARSKPLSMPVFMLELEDRGYEIISAYPLQPLSHPLPDGCSDQEQSDLSIAVLGLLDKMTGVAAVNAVDISVDENNNRRRVRTVLKALGKLGFLVVDREGARIHDQGSISINACHHAIERRYVEVKYVGSIPGGVLIEIDLERLWDEAQMSESRLEVEMLL